MGWRDAPEVEAAPKWASAPEVAPSRPVTVPSGDLGETGVGRLLLGSLPPTRGPLGGALNAITGGRYGHYAPEYGGLYAPPEKQVPRDPGESDRDYARRAASAHLADPHEADRVLPQVAMLLAPGGDRKALLAKSPEAKLLESQGVKGLTVGQSVENPGGSALAALEQATTKNPLGLGPQRAAAQRSWEVSEIAKSRKAGEAALPQDVQGAFRETHARFDPEYDALGAHPVAPGTVQGLPERALSLPGGIDKATRDAAAKEIANALTVLPEGAGVQPAPPRVIGVSRSVQAAHAGEPAAPNASPTAWREDLAGREPVPSTRTVEPIPETPEGWAEKSALPRTYPGTNRPAPAPPGEAPEWKPVFAEQPAPPSLTTGDLISVRKHIRKAQRAAVNDPDRMAALGHAEAVVTDALESSLPDDGAATLRDADARYATLMRAERAPPPGQTEFTPGQHLRSAERSSGRSTFKQGEAYGQESGEAARKVFEDMPFTGGRVGVVSALPLASKWGAPLMRLLNTEAGKRMLFETPANPWSLPPTAPALASPLANASRLARPRFAPVPVAAEERDPP